MSTPEVIPIELMVFIFVVFLPVVILGTEVFGDKHLLGLLN